MPPPPPFRHLLTYLALSLSPSILPLLFLSSFCLSPLSLFSISLLQSSSLTGEKFTCKESFGKALNCVSGHIECFPPVCVFVLPLNFNILCATLFFLSADYKFGVQLHAVDKDLPYQFNCDSSSDREQLLRSLEMITQQVSQECSPYSPPPPPPPLSFFPLSHSFPPPCSPVVSPHIYTVL